MGLLAAAGSGAWVLVRELVARREAAVAVPPPKPLTNATLELTVVRSATGDPVKGARVFVWRGDDPNAGLVGDAPLTTDSEGRATLTGPSGVRLCVLAVPPADELASGYFIEILGLTPEFRTVHHMELPAPGASILWVKLLTRDSGRPVEGRPVALNGYTGGQAGLPLRAAASPSASLAWIPPQGDGLVCIAGAPGTLVSIHVKGDGGGTVWTRVEPGHESAARARELRLTRGASLRVNVLGVDGESKQVTVRPAESRRGDVDASSLPEVSWSATSDGAGPVLVEGLPPHMRLTAELEANDATRRTAAPFSLAPEEELLWSCTIGDGVNLSGRVVDDFGVDVKGREVWLVPADSSDRLDLRRRTRVFGVGDLARRIDVSVTDSSGMFEFEDVQGGYYWVGPSARALLNPSSRAICPEAQWVDVGSGDERSVTIRVERGIFIRGRIEDEDGEPVSSALVRGYGPTMQYFTARSQKNGTFKLGPLTQGEFEVTAAGPENPLDPQSANRHAPAVKLPSGTTDAVLVLAPGLRLTGVVRDAESKRVERARVKLFRADVAVEVEARDADDAGCFEFSGLAPGTYRLSAEDLLGRSGSVPRIEISATTSSARVDVKIGVNTR